MNITKGLCFFLMPFAGEFKFTYLFLKQHLESQFRIKCERADDEVEGTPMFEKIIRKIKASDVLIADCSKLNPNVFYEIGIAHTLDKDVILITSDSTSIKDFPTDLKHWEVIPYSENDFLPKLESALTNILIKRYDILRTKFVDMIKEFNDETDSSVQLTEPDKFKEIARLERFDKCDDIQLLTKIPKIILKPTEDISKKISAWVNRRISNGTSR